MTTPSIGMLESKLAEIIKRYDRPELIVSTAYADGGIDPLWSRFYRGAGNQIDGGDATTARYAIWANTVRDNIIEGMRAMEAGDDATGRQHLIRAANSLSAFADVQAYFDPFDFGKRT